MKLVLTQHKAELYNNDQLVLTVAIENGRLSGKVADPQAINEVIVGEGVEGPSTSQLISELYRSRKVEPS